MSTLLIATTLPVKAQTPRNRTLFHDKNGHRGLGLLLLGANRNGPQGEANERSKDNPDNRLRGSHSLSSGIRTASRTRDACVAKTTDTLSPADAKTLADDQKVWAIHLLVGLVQLGSCCSAELFLAMGMVVVFTTLSDADMLAITKTSIQFMRCSGQSCETCRRIEGLIDSPRPSHGTPLLQRFSRPPRIGPTEGPDIRSGRVPIFWFRRAGAVSALSALRSSPTETAVSCAKGSWRQPRARRRGTRWRARDTPRHRRSRRCRPWRRRSRRRACAEAS